MDQDQDQGQDQEIDDSVFLNTGNGENRTIDHPVQASSAENGVIERLTLDKNQDNDEVDEV